MSYKEKIANLATVGLIITSILIFLFFLLDFTKGISSTEKEQVLNPTANNSAHISSLESNQIN